MTYCPWSFMLMLMLMLMLMHGQLLHHEAIDANILTAIALAAESCLPPCQALNRKLRHLKGLSLRNLSFDPPSHLRTSDDASLNKSPNKLEALRESGQQLHSSRSTDSLRKDALRPDTLKRARRTSLSFVHASPATRQKNLESMRDSHVGDVFFSLHVGSDGDPVYISETREKSANFNFRFFELADRGPEITRSCLLTIRIWAKRPKNSTWTFLLEEFVDLRNLNFIGTLLDRKFPPNALIFHLEDGIYSLDFPTRSSDPKQASTVASSSYAALMKLANLESSIEDAIQTQQHIMEQINSILDDTSNESPDTAAEEAALAEKYVATQQRANKLAEKKRNELRESLRNRKDIMDKGRKQQSQGEADIAADTAKLDSAKEMIEKTERQIRGQRRRICSELLDIFPIIPVPNAPPLSFQICNMPLPNSVYDAATARTLSEDVLSAALGLTTLLTRHLQFYLSTPLPYTLNSYGSRSWARDDISQLKLTERNAPRREFPLYLPKGGSTAGQWRFEYAWFLLNKDIEALCATQGLKVVDIRHTLPNLKYLLYVCSAGSEEVPERKKGGVRGLWAGRLHGRMPSLQSSQLDSELSSTAGSRRGSNDSDVASTHNGAAALRNALLKGVSGAERDGVAALSPSEALSLPFGDSETKFTLRTKGLRENVSR
ncbi:UV radiation resistance-associated protein [Paramyrothecium foliicola]|nr:UV radiation resistance-associated protein [Paramyrothecium foliicola]